MGRKKRRTKKLTIGIYIGKHDTDIADWFNMIHSQSEISFAKWIHALLAADYMNEEIDIGAIADKKVVNTQMPIQTINDLPQSGLTPARKINFGSGSTSSESFEKKKTNDRINPTGFKSGWNIKGPGGNYIYGSIVSICISTPETIELIKKNVKRNREVSTYLKALIRSRLKKEHQHRSPSDSEYLRIHDKYILAISKKEYELEETSIVYEAKQVKPHPGATEEPQEKPTKKISLPVPHETKTSQNASESVSEVSEKIQQESQPVKIKNPMLQHIS